MPFFSNACLNTEDARLKRNIYYGVDSGIIFGEKEIIRDSSYCFLTSLQLHSSREILAQNPD